MASIGYQKRHIGRAMAWVMAVFFLISCGHKTVTEEDEAKTDEVVPKPSFYAVIDGDSVAFCILPDSTSVSLTEWRHTNTNNHILTIPSQVKHNGGLYNVREIGDEAMGAADYSAKEDYLFYEGYSFEDVELIKIPPTVTKIGSAAFVFRFQDYNFKIDLPETIDYMGTDCLYCHSIIDENGDVHLPDSLKCCGGLMEYDEKPYSDLNTLYIPAGVEEFEGLFVFLRNQPHFKNVVVADGNPNYKSVNGTLYSKDGTELHWASIGDTLVVTKQLDINAALISIISETYYPHQFLNIKKFQVEPGNPYCAVYDNNLYNLEDSALVLINCESDHINVPAFCNRIEVPSANLPKHSFTFDNKAKPNDVARFLKAVYQNGFIDEPTHLSYLGHKEQLDTLSPASLLRFAEHVAAKKPSNKEIQSFPELMKAVFN